MNSQCKGAALFALVNSLLGLGSNPARHKNLSLENFLSFLSCHLTSMLGIALKYLALSLFLQCRNLNSRSVFTAHVSCRPSSLPSHTPTSSISSAHCYWSKNHLLHKLPACFCSALRQFILDLWTRTHLSKSYKHKTDCSELLVVSKNLMYRNSRLSNWSHQFLKSRHISTAYWDNKTRSAISSNCLLKI